MPFNTAAVTEWLNRHHGAIAADDLTRLGVTVDERRHLVRLGVLEPVIAGAYRFTGAAETVEQRCAAVCAARPAFVVAVTTAARLWRVPGFADVDDVHVLAPPGTRAPNCPWLHVHRIDVFPSGDLVVRADGIVVASPPRLGVSLARVIDDDQLAICLEWVLRQCAATTARRVAERLAGPRRPWVRRYLDVLDSRMPGGPRESTWEQRVMTALRRCGVTDLISQVPQRLPGYGSARFDLAIPAIRWILEVDVHPHHRTAAGQSRDFRRDRGARRSGWATERVGEDELRSRFDATMNEIAESIAKRRAEVAALQRAGLWMDCSSAS